MNKNFKKYLILTITLGVSILLYGCIMGEKRINSFTEDTEVSELESYLQSYSSKCKEKNEDIKNGISKEEKSSIPELTIKYENVFKKGRIILYSLKKDSTNMVKKEKEDVIKGNGLPKVIAKSGQYINMNFTKANQEYIGVCLLDGDKDVELDEKLFESIGKTSNQIKVPDRKGNYVLYIFSGWKDKYVIYGLNLISK